MGAVPGPSTALDGLEFTVQVSFQRSQRQSEGTLSRPPGLEQRLQDGRGFLDASQQEVIDPSGSLRRPVSIDGKEAVEPRQLDAEQAVAGLGHRRELPDRGGAQPHRGRAAGGFAGEQHGERGREHLGERLEQPVGQGLVGCERRETTVIQPPPRERVRRMGDAAGEDEAAASPDRHGKRIGRARGHMQGQVAGESGHLTKRGQQRRDQLRFISGRTPSIGLGERAQQRAMRSAGCGGIQGRNQFLRDEVGRHPSEDIEREGHRQAGGREGALRGGDRSAGSRLDERAIPPSLQGRRRRSGWRGIVAMDCSRDSPMRARADRRRPFAQQGQRPGCPAFR